MAAVLLAVAACLSSCRSGYTVVGAEGRRIPLTAAFDSCPDTEAVRLLSPYQEAVRSQMSAVIGRAARRLESYRPESPLSDLLTDIIRQTAVRQTGTAIDVAVMNIGGIRNLLEEGDITVGDIYEVCPFENRLAVVMLAGKDLSELFRQIAATGGEGLSGAELLLTKEGRLLRATVGGHPIDPKAVYRVATIDYVAEGNDRMEAFRQALSVRFLPGCLLRESVMDYVKACTAEGRPVDAVTGRRIVVDDREEGGNS